MPLRDSDIDRVASLLQETAATLILPRFRQLKPEDIERKETPTDPHDVVTIADRDAEASITRALVALLPGSTVVGEEATHANPSLLHAVHGDGPVWLLDPIDGTRNFVAGDTGFATMLGLAEAGEVVAGWIFFPAREELFVGTRGGGATLNGRPMRIAGMPAGQVPTGALHTNYMPAALRDRLRTAARGRFTRGVDARSAAVEYMEILKGDREFAVYYRLLPWDHAAPGLLVSEGGGSSRHLDGGTYGPRSADQVTIVASGLDVDEMVRRWFDQ